MILSEEAWQSKLLAVTTMRIITAENNIVPGWLSHHYVHNSLIFAILWVRYSTIISTRGTDKKNWGKVVKQFAHKVCKVAELRFPSNPGNWGGGDFFLQMAWKFYNLNKKIRPIRGNFKYAF